MKNFSRDFKIGLIVVCLISLFALKIYSQNQIDRNKPGYYKYGNIIIIIHEKKVQKFFNEKFEATTDLYDEIADSLYNSIIISLNDYAKADMTNRSGFEVPEVKAAIDEYKSGILDGTRALKVIFECTSSDGLGHLT